MANQQFLKKRHIGPGSDCENMVRPDIGLMGRKNKMTGVISIMEQNGVEPGIVTGTDEYGMPEFREGATIKVRISDEGKSMLVPLPAKIALWRELAREWQFAGRVCESKAYSRAADMLLRGDWQSSEELAEEAAEVKAVQEAKA